MEILSIPIETIHKYALFTSFAGAALAALGTGVTLWTGGVLGEQSKAHIADARDSADIARRDTESLRRENLRLQREVEELRTRRLELEKELGPRRLTPEQIEAFNSVLPPTLHGVVVAIQIHRSTEAYDYAKQIALMLVLRGVKVETVGPFNIDTFGSSQRQDIEIKITSGPGARLIEQAFAAAGFKAVVPMIPRDNELPDGKLMYDHLRCAAFIDVHAKAPVILAPLARTSVYI